MIIQKICEFLIGIVIWVINLIPVPVFLSISSSGLTDIIGFGMWVITPSIFLLISANILFWSAAHFNWSIILWIYDHIPFKST